MYLLTTATIPEHVLLGMSGPTMARRGKTRGQRKRDRRNYHAAAEQDEHKCAEELECSAATLAANRRRQKVFCNISRNVNVPIPSSSQSGDARRRTVLRG